MPVILMKSVRQLVLLGDPQQLLPTVNNSSAGTLGLCRSLLQRYIDSAAALNEQYRMVSVGAVGIWVEEQAGAVWMQTFILLLFCEHIFIFIFCSF